MTLSSDSNYALALGLAEPLPVLVPAGELLLETPAGELLLLDRPDGELLLVVPLVEAPPVEPVLGEAEALLDVEPEVVPVEAPFIEVCWEMTST